MEKMAQESQPNLKELINTFGRGGLPETKTLGEEIYGEIYLPPLSGVKAIRRTKERFDQWKIGDLGGKSVLDIGSHIGSLSFYCHQLGAHLVHGVEHNPGRTITARAIRDYNRIDKKRVEFYSDEESLMDSYDYVFCCSVDAYVEDLNGFYKFLMSKTRSLLLFESNIQEYGDHPFAQFCLNNGYKYEWLGEAVDKYPYGKDRVRNLIRVYKK